MAQYTDAELIELGKKVLVAKQKEAARTKAYNWATKSLIANHEPEFAKLLDTAKIEAGI